MLKAIIVDDEQSGSSGLEKLLAKYCKDVHIVAIADNGEEAEEQIILLKPDVVFLDIQMPFGSGFDLLKRVKDIKLQVIFTTAYSHYAIEAIKFNALDYLLKPVDAEELIEAVEKCEARKGSDIVDFKKIENLIQSLSQKRTIYKVPVHTQNGMIFYDSEKVVRIESFGNYSNIFLLGGLRITSSKTLKEYEEMLSEKEFFRIHKTSLININHVNQYIKGEGGEVLMSDGSRLEVSRYKKAELIAFLIK